MPEESSCRGLSARNGELSRGYKVRVRRWLPLCVAVVVHAILSAEPVWAWGPVTHVRLANDLLSQLALLPASVAGILARYAIDFVYGNVAADVVFAKRLSRVKQFCHHWTTGFSLLSDAENDRGRAFALGYLSHLAADTVAHNKFVPHQLMTTRTTVSLGHPYWELRADQLVEGFPWIQLSGLVRGRFHEHEASMAMRLDQALLPFRVNRRIFYSMNRLFVNQTWRRGTCVWHQLSRWRLSEEMVNDYWAECTDRALSVLAELDRSAVLREDPSGTSVLSRVRTSRRHLRSMARVGVLTLGVLTEVVSPHRPAPIRDRSGTKAAVA